MIKPDEFCFHVFSDSDGVTYDFEGEFQRRFGKRWAEVHPDWAWEQIDKEPEWYANLPLFPWAQEYWETIAPHSPTVLTGCPRKPYYDLAVVAKRKAWERDFGVTGDRIITCMSKDKPLHIKRPGDILIDDHVRNVRDWRKAGGTAILFSTHTQALEEFKRAVEALSALC